MSVYSNPPEGIDMNPEGKYGYCSYCERNVHTVIEDQGIGAYEYWGCKSRHVDLRDVCPDCGGDVNEAAREEQEV